MKHFMMLLLIMAVGGPVMAQVKKPVPQQGRSLQGKSSLPEPKELTGIWRGIFNDEESRGRYQYKYEVQFVQKPNGALNGVTYSWQNNIGFYGKANGSGIYMQNANTLVLKEEELEEVKSKNGGEGCLMTCYLDYEQLDGKQYLTGTYSSVESRNRRKPCPGGTVRLEKVPDSEFGVEPEVLKRLQEIQKAEKLAAAKLPKPKTAKANVVKPKPLPPKPAVAKTRPVPPPTAKKEPEPVRPAETAVVPEKLPLPKKPLPPPPPVLVQRKTTKEKTFVVNDRKVKITFYDMGDVDGDKISVYVNNRSVLNSVLLTGKPQSVELAVSADEPMHEVTVVAETLGSIPPNTAFVLIESGSRRYEITLSSDMSRNAQILIEYQAPK